MKINKVGCLMCCCFCVISLYAQAVNPEWLNLLNLGAQSEKAHKYTESLSYYMKAYEKGDSIISPYEIASMYVAGNSQISADISKAIKWMEISANHGNPSAMVFLGDMYYEGIGVPQNLYQSVDWYMKASKQNDADGMHKLAIAYLDGEGILKNVSKAIQLLQQAAEKGSAEAMDTLAIIYGFGKDDIEPDMNKFVFWSRMGAENGNPQSQYRLGSIYLNGLGGVKADYDEAVKWFRQSASQGYQLSIKKLSDLGY